MQVSCGDSRCHPLVISEKGQQSLPAGLRVVPVGPVCVHELDGLPEDVFALWVAIEVIHKTGHGVVKVVGLNAVFIVHDKLHKLQALALVDSQHDVVVEKLTLNKMVQKVIKKNKLRVRTLLEIAGS